MNSSTLIILAVLGVGGFVAYQMYQTSQATTQANNTQEQEQLLAQQGNSQLYGLAGNLGSSLISGLSDAFA